MEMHHPAHPGEGLQKYSPENLSVTEAEVAAILKARL